ncbi:hypothetical protein OB953_00090 [Aeromonas salmonicida]|uniref:hypothetical protein n=1 Tax=Aeromonas salmonicida TaxID=645 RepID=UPI00259D356D|nr:hypothetical protein [Aeromonas salmonicida]MDM5134011.1 hypothetical protein [Aeromonas salmonicida]
MKPRIEKKLSKKIHSILGNLLGEVWIDNELELHQPHWRHHNSDNRPLTGKQKRENWQMRVSVNHMPSIGGGLDYWGEGQDWHSALYVAKDALPWRFGETDGPHGGWPLLKAKMTGAWVIKHAKLYALQEQAKAAKKALEKARIEQLKGEGIIQWQAGKGWIGQCICCEQLTPIYCNPAEFDPNNHYCGGSPRCCP